MRLNSLSLLLLLLPLLPSVLSHSASSPAPSLADSDAPSASPVDSKSKEHPSLHDKESVAPSSSSKSDPNAPSASPIQSEKKMHEEKPKKKHEHEQKRGDHPVEYSFMFEELDNAPEASLQPSAASPSPYRHSKSSKKQKKRKKDEDEDDDGKEESKAPSSSPDQPKSSSSKKDNKKSKDKKNKFVWGLSQGVDEIGPADDFSAADAPDAGPLTTPSSGPLNPLDMATICGMSGFRSSCTSAVEAMAPGLLGTTNAATILKLTSKATLVNTHNILDKANKIVKKPETDPKTVNILLKSCVEQYQDAIKKLEGADDAVTKGDKKKMRDSLMVAEQYKSCRAAFAEVQMKLPQGMKALDETLKDLAGTNMALAKFFWPDPIFDTAFMQTLVNL